MDTCQSQASSVSEGPPISPWVLGLCSVIFDVDKGQTLQDIWPCGCLSKEEEEAAAFHAFPDSLSMELYSRNAVRDSSFTFRIKREPPQLSSTGTPEYLHGYVFCRQRQDETLKRGGEQVSVLVLSTTPFSGALLPLSHAAGHAFFNDGPVALAKLYSQVLSWPAPVPGDSMCLPLGGDVINVRLPHFCLMPPPQPVVHPAVTAILTRRISRALSLRASGSPRTPPAAAAAGTVYSAIGPSDQPAVGATAASAATAATAAATAAAAADTLPSHKSSDCVQLHHSGGSGGLQAGAVKASECACAHTEEQLQQEQGQQQQQQQGGTCMEQHSSKASAGAPSPAVPAAAQAAQQPTGDEDKCWAMVSQDVPALQSTTQHPQQAEKGQQEAQQQAPQQPYHRGRSLGGSFSSLLGLSFSSANQGDSNSQQPRPDLAASGKSSSSSNLAATADSSADVAGGSSSGVEWLATTLGQHWRDEKPFPEVEPALVLAPLLRELWTLWQLVVTGQPLMVVGLTPGETSAAVAALTCLIAPLPYAADFRPFFTIHDSDFVAMAAGQLPRRHRYHEVVMQQQQGEQQAQQLSPGQQQQLKVQQAAQRQQVDLLQQVQPQQNGHSSNTSDVGGSAGTPCTTGPVQQAAAQPQSATGSAAAQQVQKLPTHAPLLQQQQQQQQPTKHTNLPALIGITNLYFIKALPKWPNVVAVSRKEAPQAPASSTGSRQCGASTSSGDAATAAGEGASHSSPTAPGTAAAAGAVGACSGAGATSSPQSSPVPAGGRSGSGFFSATAAAAVRALQRRHQGPQHLLSHFAPHLWTCSRHVQCIRPDHGLLSKARAVIEPAVGSGGGALPAAGSSAAGALGPSSAAGAAAARLRRHFADLTAALLAPFEVYFTPGPNGKVPAWRPEAFLAGLDAAALSPVLVARFAGSAAVSAHTLYGAFIESANFAFWFQQRRAPVLHLVEEPPSEEDDDFATIAAGDADSSDAGMESEPDEVELVQQLLSTEQALLEGQQQQQLQPGGQQQQQKQAPNGRHADAQLQQQEQALQFQFVQIFIHLPRDLQAALFSNPPRQELLHETAAALAAGTSAEQAAAAAVLQKMQELLIGAEGNAGAAVAD